MIVKKVGKPASEKQVEFLLDKGLEVSDDLLASDAHRLIESIIQEEGEEPATNKQAKMLRYLKYDGDYDITKREASELISKLKENRGF